MASAAVQASTHSASVALAEPRLEQASAQEEQATESSELPARLLGASQTAGAVADAAGPAQNQGGQPDAAATDDSPAARPATEADASPAAPATLPDAPPAAATPAPATPAGRTPQARTPQAGRAATSRSVGFHPTLLRSTTVTSKATTLTRVRSPISAWRWPEENGRLPPYVKRAFRLKAFSLVFAQLSICLAGSIVVKELNEDDLVAEAMRSSLSFWILCATSLVLILLLYYYRHSYPANYVLLALNTVSITLTWSFGGVTGLLFREDSHLHLQVLGIMVVAVFVTAVVGHGLSLVRVESDLLVPSSFLVGWLAGAMANLLFVLALEDTEGSPFAAAGIAFLLYGIVLVDVGGKLMAGNPDRFMRVVISCISTLLVITSIPFMLLGFCVVQGFQNADAPENHPSGEERPPALPA